MNYVYDCENCNESFELELPSKDNKKPLSEPCPICGKSGEIYRNFSGINFGGESDVQKKAGTGFNDILKDINKKAGSQSTMGKYIG